MNKNLEILFSKLKNRQIRPNEKAVIIFICIFLSTFFWFLASLSKNYSTVLSIPLDYDKVSDGYQRTNEPISRLQVHVKGSGFELLGEQLGLNKNSIQLDFNAALNTSRNRLTISTKSLFTKVRDAIDDELLIDHISPDSIVIEVQPLVNKLLKVIPDIEIKLDEGYQVVGNIISEPSELNVSGPKSLLDTIDGIKTEILSVPKLNDTLIQRVELDKALTPYLNIDIQDVQLTIPVEKFTEKKVNLGVEVISDSLDILTFPDQVEVILLLPLSHYEILNASSLKAEVLFEKDGLDQSKLPVRLSSLPDYAKLVRINPPKVEYIIKK